MEYRLVAVFVKVEYSMLTTSHPPNVIHMVSVPGFRFVSVYHCKTNRRMG